MLIPSVACVAELPHEWRLVLARPQRPKALAWDLIERELPYYLPLRKEGKYVLPLFGCYLFVCGFEAADYCRRSSHVCTVTEIPSKGAQHRLVRDLASIEILLFHDPSIDVSPIKELEQLVRVTGGPLEGTVGYTRRFWERDDVAMVLVGCKDVGLAASVEVERTLLELI